MNTLSSFRITPAAARVNAGLTQKQAAKALNISNKTLLNYEKGITVPDWTTVDRMCALYGCPSDLIFFGRNLALSGIDA